MNIFIVKHAQLLEDKRSGTNTPVLEKNQKSQKYKDIKPFLVLTLL